MDIIESIRVLKSCRNLTAAILVFLSIVAYVGCSSLLPYHGSWTSSPNKLLQTPSLKIKTITKPQTHHTTNRTTFDKDFPTLIQRVQRRMTQSREAKWASLSLSVICILLVFGVCYSKMWKEYRGAQYYHPNLPVLKESIPLIDVFSRKLRFKRKDQKPQVLNLQEDEEQLLA